MKQKLQTLKFENVMKIANGFHKVVFRPTINAHTSAASMWNQTKDFMKRHNMDYNPMQAISVYMGITEHLAAATRRVYLSQIRSQFPDDFEGLHKTCWKRTIDHLLALSTIKKDAEGSGANPISSAEMKQLITNTKLDRNMRILAFRMWVQAVRFSDLKTQIHFQHHPTHNTTIMKQQLDKAHKRDCFFRAIPATATQNALIWAPKIMIPKYNDFMRWLKENTKTATCHSFRRGAIQVLQQHFIIKQIELLSGHGTHSGILAYTTMSIHDYEFTMQRKMTTQLIQELCPDMNYEKLF